MPGRLTLREASKQSGISIRKLAFLIRTGVIGAEVQGEQLFVSDSELRGYAEGRSSPRSLAEGHASGLSPYLHFGHLSIEEVAEKVLAISATSSLPLTCTRTSIFPRRISCMPSITT